MNKSPDQSKTDEYYTNMFTRNHDTATPYPNIVEARRWAKISEYLSLISGMDKTAGETRLRILDVGCGRGWLVRLASVYGSCDGIDPVAGSIQHAKNMFPDMNFYTGELPSLIRDPSFIPYDVVVSTEVIEHVVDQDCFVAALAESLLPGGYAIITTPRGEMFNNFKKTCDQQPVEKWLSEKELRLLFESHGFSAVARDRVYDDLPMLSFFHRLCTSRKLARYMDRMSICCIHKAMQYTTSIYQVWLFRKNCP